VRARSVGTPRRRGKKAVERRSSSSEEKEEEEVVGGGGREGRMDKEEGNVGGNAGAKREESNANARLKKLGSSPLPVAMERCVT